MSRLVFDIGGTHMRMAIADGGAIGPVTKRATPERPEEAIEALANFSGSALTESFGGIAGIIQEGTIIDSPNLPSWNGFPFATALSERTNAPARVRNDAEMAAFGEAVSGAGSEYERVAYLTIGTGVGGALIVGKALPPAGTSYEPGRMIVDTAHERSLESYVGGAALKAEFGAPAETLPREVFTERTSWLAAGISRVIDEWSPDVVLLNGALMNEETAFRLSEVARAVQALRGGPMPPILNAALGDASALSGAAAC